MVLKNRYQALSIVRSGEFDSGDEPAVVTSSSPTLDPEPLEPLFAALFANLGLIATPHETYNTNNYGRGMAQGTTV